MRAGSGGPGVADSRMLLLAQGYSKALVLSQPLWHHAGQVILLH